MSVQFSLFSITTNGCTGAIQIQYKHIQDSNSSKLFLTDIVNNCQILASCFNRFTFFVLKSFFIVCTFADLQKCTGGYKILKGDKYWHLNKIWNSSPVLFELQRWHIISSHAINVLIKPATNDHAKQDLLLTSFWFAIQDTMFLFIYCLCSCKWQWQHSAWVIWSSIPVKIRSI